MSLIVFLLVGILIAEGSYLGRRERLRVGPYMCIVLLWPILVLQAAFKKR